MNSSNKNKIILLKTYKPMMLLADTKILSHNLAILTVHIDMRWTKYVQLPTYTDNVALPAF